MLIGTGSPSQSWARSLHAAQVGVPLLETLLADLKEHAKKHGVPVARAGTAGGRDARRRQARALMARARASDELSGIKSTLLGLRVTRRPNLRSHAALRSPRLGAAGVSCGSGNVM